MKYQFSRWREWKLKVFFLRWCYFHFQYQGLSEIRPIQILQSSECTTVLEKNLNNLKDYGRLVMWLFVKIILQVWHCSCVLASDGPIWPQCHPLTGKTWVWDMFLKGRVNNYAANFLPLVASSLYVNGIDELLLFFGCLIHRVLRVGWKSPYQMIYWRHLPMV